MSVTTPTGGAVNEADALGPIDVVVIAFPPDAPMTGEAAAALIDAVDRRIIRVLDVKFVRREADGRYSGFDATNLTDRGIGSFREFEGASSGLLGDEDVAMAAEAIEPGSAAALIVYENRWALPFVAAVRRAGGEAVAFERIPVADVIAALDRAEGAASS